MFRRRLTRARARFGGAKSLWNHAQRLFGDARSRRRFLSHRTCHARGRVPGADLRNGWRCHRSGTLRGHFGAAPGLICHPRGRCGALPPRFASRPALFEVCAGLLGRRAAVAGEVTTRFRSLSTLFTGSASRPRLAKRQADSRAPSARRAAGDVTFRRPSREGTRCPTTKSTPMKSSARPSTGR